MTSVRITMARVRKATVLLLLCALASLVLASGQEAQAVRIHQGALVITVEPSGAMQPATYTLGMFRTENNTSEVIGYTIAFHPDTNVSGVTSPDGTVSSPGPGIVHVQLYNGIGRNTNFSITLDGVINPLIPGTYSVSEVTFHRAEGDRVVPIPPDQNSYTVTPEPHLSVSLSTGSIAFDLYPEEPAPPQPVDVTIESSHDFTITREIAGDAALFGLTVDGQAEGAKPAGIATFMDSYSAQAPWTTEGDRTYTATVTYTVVQ